MKKSAITCTLQSGYISYIFAISKKDSKHKGKLMLTVYATVY